MDGLDLLYQTNKFPRACRLGGRTAIRETAMKGRKLAAVSVGISYIEKETTRFGISISRQTGNAVTRNRLRRLIREFLRTNKQLWPDKRWVLIKIIKPPEQKSRLIADLKDLLTKIK